jgi:hypothetical protein
LLAQYVALEASVAFEGDTVDRDLLADGDDGPRVAMADLDAREEPGGQELLSDVFVRAALHLVDDAPDGLRIDGSIALHGHASDRSRDAARRRRDQGRGEKGETPRLEGKARKNACHR